MIRRLVQKSWVLLLAVFVLSSIGKLADPAAFAFQIESLGVPARWSWPAALGVLFLELAISVGLVLRPYRQKAAAAAAVLLLGFAAGLAWLLAHGNQGADCGCFGTIVSLRVEPLRVVENIVLAFLALGVSVGAGGRAKELAPSTTAGHHQALPTASLSGGWPPSA